MNKSINTFTVVDARTLDGNPYEVAEAAAVQASALLELSLEYVDIARRMGRNAHDERELHFHGAIEHVFEGNGVDRQFRVISENLQQAILKMQTLTRAVSADPRAKA